MLLAKGQILATQGNWVPKLLLCVQIKFMQTKPAQVSNGLVRERVKAGALRQLVECLFKVHFVSLVKRGSDNLFRADAIIT
jgi:hypothetical protein